MSEREEPLYLLRKGAYEFLQETKNYPLPEGPVIEVGKALTEGKVYEQYPEFYVDTKKFFAPRPLVQVDIDAKTQPDICCDIVDIDRHVKSESAAAVLLLHILEHVCELWKVPEKVYSILKPGGLLFIQTPWNFRFHGPRPDCWRISDDGYQALLKDRFEILKLEQYNPQGQHLHPLMINVVAKKI